MNVYLYTAHRDTNRKLAEPQPSQDETSHSGDAAEFQEPVEEPSERNLLDSGETHERPVRQLKAPTMLTYHTLGISKGVTPSAAG